MKFSLIVATDVNGIIGNQGDLPWPRIKEDLSHFRRKTLGYPVIMGRNTWNSIGKHPLPRRMNYIVSSTMTDDEVPADSQGTMVYVVRSLQEALDHIEQSPVITKRPFVIGGAQLYTEALKHPKLGWMDITTVEAAFAGDTRMPTIDFDQWLLTDETAVYDGTSQLHLTRRAYRRK